MDGYFSDSQTLRTRSTHPLGTVDSNPSPVSPSSDTPFMTPMLDGSRSRRSSRISPISASTTPPIFPVKENGNAKVQASVNGLHMSQMDPNQLNESLHASLVSEILSLRREVESKHHIIEGLETNLSSSRNEVEVLEQKISLHSKEHRSVKKQLQAIEDSTLHAIEEIAKERDEARSVNAELKKRLDVSQQKAKNLDAEAKKIGDLLDRERRGWDGERQQLQRKVSNAERNLQTVVDEFAIQQRQLDEAVDQANSPHEGPDASAQAEQHMSPAKSHRRVRSSISSIATKRSVPAGLTLADELDLDNDSSEGEDEKEHIEEAPSIADHDLNAAEYKNTPRTSEERRVPSIVSHFQTLQSSSSTKPTPRQDTPKRRSIASFTSDAEEEEQVAQQLQFVKVTELKHSPQSLQDGLNSLEQEANHGRKRDPVRTSSLQNQAHQTIDSDPFTESGNDGASHNVQQSQSAALCDTCKRNILEPIHSTSIATQTDPSELSTESDTAQAPPMPTRAPPPVPVQAPTVPTIAIHPPESTDTSPRVSMLPPRTRNVGCQTDLPLPVVQAVRKPTTTTGMQTEAIRVDQRTYKLPPHLLPSAISQSSLSSATPSHTDRDMAAVFDEPASVDSQKTRTNYLLESPPSSPLLSASENLDRLIHDDGDSPAWASLKRSLLLASGKTSYEYQLGQDFEGLDLSDDDFSIPRTRIQQRAPRNARPFVGPPTPVPEDEKAVPSKQGHRSRGSGSSKGSLDRVREGRIGGLRHSRRRSVLSDSTAQHSRNSSFGSLNSSNFTRSTATGPRPPFAIPMRSSSRYPRKSRRLRSDDRSSPTKNWDTSAQARNSRLGAKPPPLRKARSANALKLRPSQDSSLRSELTPRSVTFGLDEEHPRTGFSNQNHHQHKISASRSIPQSEVVHPTGSASVAGSLQHSVVDAITATMIGEWMFKYVRKRKSFGVGDDKDEFAMTSDARHKRWVWLSPYERTIMWSGKQPTSNQALLGKAGRKLPIKSVLDVKDMTPPPKNVAPHEIFDRSILILTPVRALKVTASTRERHYLWLTALSFLAQNTSHGVPDLRFLPDKPRLPTAADAATTSSVASRTSSVKAPNFAAAFRNSKSKSSVASSGHTTPAISEGATTAGAIYPFQSQSQVSDTAFAPNVPRVPHSRKRSATNPTRGRNGFSAGALRSQSAAARDRNKIASSNASIMSNGTKHSASLRAISASGASSVRNLQSPDYSFGREALMEEEDDDDDGRHGDSLVVPDIRRGRDLSTRPSAEFGGNSSFFDAVEIVRMDAFAGPGVRPGTGAESLSSATLNNLPASRNLLARPLMSPPERPAPGPPANSGPISAVVNAHRKGEASQDSFIGPPNISRVRRDPRAKAKEEKKWTLAAKQKGKPKDGEKYRKGDIEIDDDM